jgi:hypothetical protein
MHPAWTDAEEALLGTKPDKTVARLIGRSVTAIQVRRGLKGIPITNPKHKPWRAEDEAVLGTRPDRQIAMLLGRSLIAVKTRREMLKIRPYPGRRINRVG